MSISLCYITPSFRGDIERFALLRRSLRLFSPTIPHLVYVHTEDCRLFRQRFGAEPNLTIVPTAEILPPAVERERRFWCGRRGWVAERIGWRLGLYRRFSGWKLQQLIKLEALARLPAEAGIFLDSDIFLCGPVDETEFITAASELRLLETPAENYWDFGFEVGRSSARPAAGRADGGVQLHPPGAALPSPHRCPASSSSCSRTFVCPLRPTFPRPWRSSNSWRRQALPRRTRHGCSRRLHGTATGQASQDEP